MENRLYARQHD